jgi:phosphoglycolate phosphatase
MQPENLKIDSIIFDLDGTLVNTIPDVLLALNHTLKTFDGAPIASDQVYELIGNGARFMIENAFAKSKTIFSRAEIDEALACYLKFYREHPVVESKIYPGVLDILQHYKNENIALGICTNKPGVVVRVLLEELQMKQFFSAVLCGDEVSYPKPDAQHIYDVLIRMDCSRYSTVLVGDSHIDQLCAQNAGIPFIGASYGYDSATITSELRINHMNELPALIKKITSEEKILWPA